MANIVGTTAEIIYATAGNIGHPGTAAQRTAANTLAVADLNAQLNQGNGPSVGVTVSAVTVPAAR